MPIKLLYELIRNLFINKYTYYRILFIKRVKMKEIIDTLLDDTKIIYKESILLENHLLEDKLLNIMSNLKYLQREVDKFKLQKKTIKKQGHELIEDEIEKVKRKIPLWLNKKNQYNYKILKAFMDLSNNNSHYVNIITLEKHCNISNSKIFLTNYNLLKGISKKNHGKVFQQNDDQVRLWDPVADIIIEYFS